MNCNLCGKVLETVRPGSMTGWIFGPTRCKCSLSSTLKELPILKDTLQITETNEKLKLSKITSRYKPLGTIAKGGMGFVFLALDNHLERYCVVKTMKTDSQSDPLAFVRFEQEARLCAGFEHPNLVRVTDYGLTDEGIPFLVMDYVEGTTLRALIDEKKTFSVVEAAGVISKVCAAIAYVHNLKLIHRDLKPENILLSENSNGNIEVRILDFGIAIQDYETGEMQRLTQTGEVFGTPRYMSPEQCISGKVDNRSDIYSIGCILYEMISGQPPFRGNLIDVMEKHVNEIPDAPSKKVSGKKDSSEFDKLVLRCLAKDPESRFQSTKELESKLTRLIPAAHQSYALIGISSTIVTAVVVAFCFYLSSSTSETTKPNGDLEKNYITEKIFESMMLSAVSRQKEAVEYLRDIEPKKGSDDELFVLSMNKLVSLKSELAMNYSTKSRDIFKRIQLSARRINKDVEDKSELLNSTNPSSFTLLSSSVCHFLYANLITEEGQRMAAAATTNYHGRGFPNVLEFLRDNPQVLKIYSEAASSLEKSVNLANRVKTQKESSHYKLKYALLSAYYESLKSTYVCLGKNDKTIKACRSAIECFEKVDEVSDLSKILSCKALIGKSFFEKKEYANSIAAYKEAVSFYHKSKSRFRRPIEYNVKATLITISNELKEAKKKLEEQKQSTVE